MIESTISNLTKLYFKYNNRYTNKRFINLIANKKVSNIVKYFNESPYFFKICECSNNCQYLIPYNDRFKPITKIEKYIKHGCIYALHLKD